MKKILLLLLFCSYSMAQNVQLSEENYWADRKSATEYVLYQKGKKKRKIFVGTNPQNIDFTKTKAILKDSVSISTQANERLYFAIINKKDTTVFSERRLWVENAPNFRDLGGFKTIDSRTVAWGKLFRCGDMGTLSEKDLDVLKRESIKNVIDFRNEQEIKQSPDKYPTGYETNRVWTSISPSNGEGMKRFYALMSNPNATAQEAEAVFEEFYAKMDENIKNYAPFFETLLNAPSDQSTLFHCTAGKDRTGFGSALLLSVLGVSEKTIIEEYHLSNRYTQYLAKGGMMSRMKPEIAKVLAGVEPKYIQATLKSIKEKYGTVNVMLEKELGIDAAKRKILIDKYTL